MGARAFCEYGISRKPFRHVYKAHIGMSPQGAHACSHNLGRALFFTALLRSFDATCSLFDVSVVSRHAHVNERCMNRVCRTAPLSSSRTPGARAHVGAEPPQRTPQASAWRSPNIPRDTTHALTDLRATVCEPARPPSRPVWPRAARSRRRAGSAPARAPPSPRRASRGRRRSWRSRRAAART